MPVGTESADTRYAGLDSWDDTAILAAVLDGQKRALASIDAALPALGHAAQAGADALKAGGRLVYIAAGSPALIALGDALEIPQTYGIAREKIVLLFAGGEAITRTLTGAPEDDTGQAARDVASAGVSPSDCTISISASGTTPYTLAGLRAARAAGAKTVALASNPGAALLTDADIPVLLESGPEVISGSTRMGAGTAQKAALNMLSTLIGVRMGHVHDNLMVNLMADNEKLISRAVSIIARISRTGPDAARAALAAANGDVKPAILLAAGARDLPEAQETIARAGGTVREALKLLQ